MTGIAGHSCHRLVTPRSHGPPRLISDLPRLAQPVPARLGHAEQSDSPRSGQPLPAGRVDRVSGTGGGVNVPERLCRVRPERDARVAATRRRLSDGLDQRPVRCHVDQVHERGQVLGQCRAESVEVEYPVRPRRQLGDPQAVGGERRQRRPHPLVNTVTVSPARSGHAHNRVASAAVALSTNASPSGRTPSSPASGVAARGEHRLRVLLRDVGAGLRLAPHVVAHRARRLGGASAGRGAVEVQPAERRALLGPGARHVAGQLPPPIRGRAQSRNARSMPRAGSSRQARASARKADEKRVLRHCGQPEVTPAPGRTTDRWSTCR